MSEGTPAPVPQIPMPARTLIIDVGSGQQLLWIDGYMPLPVGARVQLGGQSDTDPPPSDGEVTGIRVWGAGPSGTAATLVLEVMLVAPDDATDRP
jgi:hypothetical protein